MRSTSNATAAVLARLRALRDQWWEHRQQIFARGQDDGSQTSALRDCADDLDALLTQLEQEMKHDEENLSRVAMTGEADQSLTAADISLPFNSYNTDQLTRGLPSRPAASREPTADEAERIGENLARSVTRFEVIGDAGRVLIARPCDIDLSFQDQGRTLKVFVKGKTLLHESRSPVVNGQLGSTDTRGHASDSGGVTLTAESSAQATPQAGSNPADSQPVAPADAPRSFPIYEATEWQCRFVFEDRRCCGLRLNHAGEHVPATRSVGYPVAYVCPRCGGSNTTFILESFGAGWRLYCEACCSDVVSRLRATSAHIDSPTVPVAPADAPAPAAPVKEVPPNGLRALIAALEYRVSHPGWNDAPQFQAGLTWAINTACQIEQREVAARPSPWPPAWQAMEKETDEKKS